MKTPKMYLILLSLVAAWIGIGPEYASASSYEMVPRNSIEALKDKLNDPGLFILDVRLPRHIEASPYKLSGAVWVNPAGVNTWSQFFPRDAVFVLY